MVARLCIDTAANGRVQSYPAATKHRERRDEVACAQREGEQRPFLVVLPHDVIRKDVHQSTFRCLANVARAATVTAARDPRRHRREKNAQGTLSDRVLVFGDTQLLTYSPRKVDSGTGGTQAGRMEWLGDTQIVHADEIEFGRQDDQAIAEVIRDTPQRFDQDKQFVTSSCDR